MAELFGLTTVEQAVEEQGRLSGEMAIRLLRGEELDADLGRRAVAARRCGRRPHALPVP